MGDLVRALQERGYGLLILFLTLPNGVPGPAIPGLSTITGLPALIFALEAATGRREPRLPKFAGRQRLNRYRVIRHLERVRPYILNIESKMTNRLNWLVELKHLNFTLCAIFSLVLAIPIPFGNLVTAWSVIVLSLGMVSKDGLFILAGIIFGIVATIWNIALLILGKKLIEMVWGMLFG